jgi:hypothetical protein
MASYALAGKQLLEKVERVEAQSFTLPLLAKPGLAQGQDGRLARRQSGELAVIPKALVSRLVARVMYSTTIGRRLSYLTSANEEQVGEQQ